MRVNISYSFLFLCVKTSRFQYLSNAVLQAKSASIGTMSSDIGDGCLLELLEGKLAVLRFQIRIKEELEILIRRSEGSHTGDLSDTLMKDSTCI